MFYSVNFWRQLAFFAFKYSLVLACFLVWVLMNNFTNATIILLLTVINLFSVITVASSVIALVLVFMKKRQKHYQLWQLYLVDSLIVILFLITNSVSTLLNNGLKPF